MAFANPKVRLDVPLRREISISIIVALEPVFDDATNFDIWECEHLGHELGALGLFDQLLVRLACEGDDRAVGMDGAALNIIYGISVFASSIRQFNICKLLAAFVENL